MLEHVLLQQAKTALHMNRHKFAPEHVTYGGGKCKPQVRYKLSEATSVEVTGWVQEKTT